MGQEACLGLRTRRFVVGGSCISLNPIYKPNKLILSTGSNICKVPYTVFGLLSPESGCSVDDKRGGGSGGKPHNKYVKRRKATIAFSTQSGDVVIVIFLKYCTLLV
jgi:hypothetical protein